MSKRSKSTIYKPSAKRSGGVWVAEIYPTSVSTFYHRSVLGMVLYDVSGPRRIVNVDGEYSSANISHSRNELVRRFLAGSAEWMLLIDSDMSFDPDLIDGLLFNASPDRAPIVGGLCFGINDEVMFPTLYHLVKDEDGQLATVKHQGPVPESTMYQVAATGAACLLVHRSVLEAVEAHGFNRTFPWFQETEMFGRPCGEDFTFCLRAGQLGFPVYVNTAVEVGHHKSHILTAAKYRAQLEEASP